MNIPEGFLYFETQRMKNSWLYKLVTVVFAIITVFVAFPYFKLSDNGVQNRSGILIPLLIILAVWALITLLMSKSSLEIGIRDDGLYFRMKPFMFSFKKVKFDDIDNVDLIGISVFRYGYGMHFGIGWKAYTLASNIGIKIELKNGKSIILSIKRPMMVMAILSQYVKVRD